MFYKAVSFLGLFVLSAFLIQSRLKKRECFPDPKEGTEGEKLRLLGDLVAAKMGK